MAKKHRAVYMNEKLIPGFFFAICTSEKQWLQECKELGPRAIGNPFIASGKGATTYSFENKDNGGTVVIVNIDKTVCEKEYAKCQIGAMIAHECLHALNSLLDHVGECSSHDHFAIYYFQAMVQHCLDVLWEEP